MNEFTNILKKLNELPIYLAGHINPDQDSICSCLALALFLKSIGKQAYVLLKDEDLDIINWNPNPKLIINDIKTTNSFNFIALDVNEKKRLGDYEKYFDLAKFTINIDHHQDNKYESDFTISNPNASATCEIIFDIINNYDMNLLTPQICQYLYSGILNDTNCFTRRISNNTLYIVQQLINKNINYSNIINETFSQRSLYEYKALSKVINEIEFDEFHYVVIDKSFDEYKYLTHNQIVKKIAEDLRKIKGIETLILLIKDGNKIVGKCMTNINANANKIAEIFNGGGHKKEAGFTIYDEYIDNIIYKIKLFILKKESH